jgi:hypothetical protein
MDTNYCVCTSSLDLHTAQYALSPTSQNARPRPLTTPRMIITGKLWSTSGSKQTRRLPTGRRSIKQTSRMARDVLFQQSGLICFASLCFASAFRPTILAFCVSARAFCKFCFFGIHRAECSCTMFRIRTGCLKCQSVEFR